MSSFRLFHLLILILYHQADLRKQAGSLTVRFHGFPKNGHRIPFNQILKIAKDAGADYFVHMNDEFLTKQWTTLGVKKLASYDPPNVGVVGPTCHQGNVAILTHDMTHRTHMDIFNDNYYPTVFDNWFVDTWISKVYGPKRTTKIPTWQVKHHTVLHGTRYKVSHDQRHVLSLEVSRGNSRVQSWIDRNVSKDSKSLVGAKDSTDGKPTRCTVTVLTMNRANSLKRTLYSLEHAEYGGDLIELVIKIDHSNDSSAVVDLAKSYTFFHGPKTVSVATANKGLRQAWFEAWTPRDDHDCGIIIEDDVDLSTQWYVWLKAAWRAYGHRDDLAGISLSRQVLVPKTPSKTMEIVNDHKPFMYALVGSQGFSPHPKQWSSFLKWIQSIDLKTADVSTPGLVTSDWWKALDKRTMWTQHFIFFTKQYGLYTLYVNLPDNVALAAHHREKGQHFTKTEGRDFQLATKVAMEFPAELNKYGWDGVKI